MTWAKVVADKPILGLVVANKKGLKCGGMTLEEIHMFNKITPTTSWADCLQSKTFDLMGHWHHVVAPNMGHAKGFVLHGGTSARLYGLLRALQAWGAKDHFLYNDAKPEDNSADNKSVLRVVLALEKVYEDCKTLLQEEEKAFKEIGKGGKFTLPNSFKQFSTVHPAAEKLNDSLRYVALREKYLPGMSRAHFMTLAFLLDATSVAIILETKKAEKEGKLLRDRPFQDTVTTLVAGYTPTIEGFFGAQQLAIIDNLIIPLIVRHHAKFRKDNGFLNTPETSLSHVQTKMRAICTCNGSNVFDNEVTKYCIKMAITECNELLKHWIIIHSYIPYLAGSHVWDTVVLGSAVLYQHYRHQPVPNSILGSTDKFLDKVRFSLLAKIWLSPYSPLRCMWLPPTSSIKPVSLQQQQKYRQDLLKEHVPGGLDKLDGYRNSLAVLQHQEAMVYTDGKDIFPCFSRSTEEWNAIIEAGDLASVTANGFVDSLDYEHKVRMIKTSDALAPVHPDQKAKPEQHEPPVKSDQPPATESSDLHQPASVGSKSPSSTVAPSPPASPKQVKDKDAQQEQNKILSDKLMAEVEKIEKQPDSESNSDEENEFRG